MERSYPVLRGFAFSGFLLALLGASLPAWNYHINERYDAAGWLFFAVSGGVLAAVELRRHFVRTIAPGRLRLGGCGIASASLIALSLLSPPVPFFAQFCGWLAIGFAAGLVNVSLFESIHAVYRTDPASTITRAGIFFGAGCLASAAAVASIVHFGFVSQLLIPLSVAPLLLGGLFLRVDNAPVDFAPEPPFREAMREFSKPAALLFASLLLFQSGSEWTVAGWLPLFLTHRLGFSPEGALWMLTLYWLALLLGRVGNIYLLAHVRHGRMLFVSAGSALFGCLLLVGTDNSFGTVVAILLLGGGFAAIYPLVAEKMGTRFPDYHPGVFNSIFSLASAGGLLFPFFAGLLARSVSLTAIMAIPAIGIFLVVALLLVVWLESKVTGR